MYLHSTPQIASCPPSKVVASALVMAHNFSGVGVLAPSGPFA